MPAIHSEQNQNHHEQLCRLIKRSSIGKEQPTNQPTNTISFEEACRCYLTDTEIKVLKLIARGFTCKEIAGRRGNKTSTIQTHRKRIKNKLGLSGHGSLERWCWEYTDDIQGFTF